MRVWSFGGCEYAEEGRRLWIRGRPAKLGDRVLDVLQALLSAADHTCSSVKLSRLWGPSGSLDSAKDAIRQLRRAFDQAGLPKDLIRTLRGTGFQLTGTVSERTFELNELWRSMRRGGLAPGLDGWELELPLEPGQRCRVWQIRKPDTHQVRIVKYATDATRRSALRRETRAWEAFETALPNQRSFVRIFSSHLTSWPCFVESEYGGLNLIAWSETQRLHGGLSRVTCLEIAADLANALGAAHSLGIVHNDLKPTNVLISPGPGVGTPWQVKIADFGIASVVRDNRLAEFHLGDRTLQPPLNGAGGTSLYLAPEVGAGATPTPEADIYALGVILFQLLCGDYRKTPYPGWEKEIADELLESDINAACNIDPARRPKAPIFAEWLRSVEDRRADALRRDTEHSKQFEQIRLAEEAAREAKERLTTELARRPIQRALALSLAVLGIVLAIGALLEIRSLRSARDKARAERQQAQTIQRFMDQLLFDGDAALHGPITAEALTERGLEKAHVLESQPQVHAGLLNTLGLGFEALGDYPKAEQVLNRALTERSRLFGASSPEVAETLIAQAALADDEHKLQLAMELGGRALRIQQQTLAKDDVAIARSQTKIAEFLTEAGEYSQAATLLQGTIHREQGRPELIADLSTALNDFSIVRNYQGDLQSSLALQQQSMAIDRDLLGARHPDIAEHLLTLANTHDLLGEHERAATDAREALSILEEWLPHGHHEIAAAQAQLGTSLANLPGSLPEAGAMLEQAIRILGQEPERSRTEAYADVALASVRLQQGENAEALLTYENSLAIYQRISPKPAFAWIIPLDGMAVVYERLHRWPDLQRTASQAYEIARATLPPDDPRRLNAAVLEARSLLQQGRPGPAESLLRDVLAHAPNGNARTRKNRDDANRALLQTTPHSA